MSEVFLSDYSKVYNVVYKEKKYSQEVNYILKILHNNKNKIKDILDLGSGTGNHLIFFKKKKIKILGVEKSQKMIDLANPDVKNLILKSDIKRLNLKKRFDVVTSLFHVVSYFNQNHELELFFKTAHKHLKKNGLFFFDFWFTPAVEFLKPTKKIKYFRGNNFILKKTSIPKIIKKNIVKVNFVFSIKFNDKKKKIFKETHKVRHFSIEELIFFANKNGFDYINSYQMLTTRKPNKRSWGVCMVLKKLN
tara:strand:- start:168 stop:914 length:747 start_codon:yes stop_codon:yes gene_type:complete